MWGRPRRATAPRTVSRITSSAGPRGECVGAAALDCRSDIPLALSLETAARPRCVGADYRAAAADPCRVPRGRPPCAPDMEGDLLHEVAGALRSMVCQLPAAPVLTSPATPYPCRVGGRRPRA